MTSRLKAGMSCGLRLVTRLPSTTTSSSTHSAPALRRSVFSDGHAAMRRPRASFASIIVHGPWQIAATGFPSRKNAFTNSTAFGSIRSLSGFITPPGRSRVSKSCGLARSIGKSTGKSSPHSVNFHPRTFSCFGETMRVVAPALSSAFRGSVSSTCSKPSVTKIATLTPSRSAIGLLLKSKILGKTLLVELRCQHLDLQNRRRRNKQLGGFGLERGGDAPHKMRLAAGLIRKNVEDAERRGAQAKREPCRRRRLFLNDRQSLTQEFFDLAFPAGFRLQVNEQSDFDHIFSFFSAPVPRHALRFPAIGGPFD